MDPIWYNRETDPPKTDAERQRRAEALDALWRRDAPTKRPPLSSASSTTKIVDQSEEEVFYWYNMLKLYRRHNASRPFDQFWRQTQEESYRLMHEENIDGKVADHYWDEAEVNIKKRWEKQGIWRPNWTQDARNGVGVRWKHEDPLGQEDELESEAWKPLQPPQQARKTPPSKEEWAKMAQDREASRPCWQFAHEEKEAQETLLHAHEEKSGRKREQFEPREQIKLLREAYAQVVGRWKRREIRSRRWKEVRPGKTWMHEMSFEKLLVEESLKSKQEIYDQHGSLIEEFVGLYGREPGFWEPLVADTATKAD